MALVLGLESRHYNSQLRNYDDLVGYPASAVRLGDAQASAPGGGSPQPLPQAVSLTMPAPAGSLVYSRGFSYSPSGGQYQVLDLAEASGRTASGRAIWIYAHASGTVWWFPGPLEVAARARAHLRPPAISRRLRRLRSIPRSLLLGLGQGRRRRLTRRRAG